MRDIKKHFPVNWIDGMKINKSHFIDQDNAYTDALQEVVSLHLSPLLYGVLPPSVAGEDGFNVKISLDNQQSVKVTVISCNAVTSGGVFISLPAASPVGLAATGNSLTSIFPLNTAEGDTTSWIFLIVHPFQKQASGSPDRAENPPRMPFLLPTYTLELVNGIDYWQYANHPYALAIGKIAMKGGTAKIEDDYIPPCFSVTANTDLVALHGELDKFFADLELYCSQIVQKIFKRNQQNEISELVMFLCDRIMLFLAQTITAMRWQLLYQPPVNMFANISTLARVMKNSIDMRIGSGKDELMNYLTEWCELKQGELESMLANLSNTPFDHNDINKNIQRAIRFVKTTIRLFETLSKLEFIGKRKESGIFVKEEAVNRSTGNNDQAKGKRRFFG